MNRITIGNQSIDLKWIRYVDLNYKVQGGVSRVVLGLAQDWDAMRERGDRLFFSDNEAEQLRQFFTQPENLQNHVVVFST